MESQETAQPVTQTGRKGIGGRPSVITPELITEICVRISEGESLRAVCRDKAMPSRSTVARALQEIPEYRAQYAQARELLYQHWAEELLEISDDGTTDYVTKVGRNGHEYEAVDQEHIQRSRLRVDTRKWLLSKLMPKQFGDRVQHDHEHEHSGHVTHSLSDKEKMRRMALFMLEDRSTTIRGVASDVTELHGDDSSALNESTDDDGDEWPELESDEPAA